MIKLSKTKQKFAGRYGNMDTRISGKTRLLGVFGTPIRHSGSPVMYNFSFDYYGIDCVYLAFDCGESQMKDSLTAMRRLNIMA